MNSCCLINKSVFKTDVFDHSTIYLLKLARIGIEPILLEYEPKELPLLYLTNFMDKWTRTTKKFNFLISKISVFAISPYPQIKKREVGFEPTKIIYQQIYSLSLLTTQQFSFKKFNSNLAKQN